MALDIIAYKSNEPREFSHTLMSPTLHQELMEGERFNKKHPFWQIRDYYKADGIYQEKEIDNLLEEFKKNKNKLTPSCKKELSNIIEFIEQKKPLRLAIQGD